jgi:chromosome segregation ATPase
MTHEHESERAVLTAELERFESDLAGLKNELAEIEKEREARRDKNLYLGVPQGSHHSDLMHSIPDLEAQIEVLQDQLALLDRTDEFLRKVKESDIAAAAAREKAADAEKRYSGLKDQITRLNHRIEELRRENHNAEDQASTAEAAAAQNYASAVSGGDKKTEKTALAEVRKAQEATSAVRDGVASNETIISALAAEIELLEAQATATREEADSLRAEMYRAAMTNLQGQWDDAVSALSDIGERLVKATRRAGMSSSLYSLHIPFFRPNATYVDERSLGRMADEINDDDLIANIIKEVQ